MKKRKVIDWLTMTGHDAASALDYIPVGLKVKKSLHAVRFYPTRYALEPCGMIAIGADDRQGFEIQFTGADCRKMEKEGMSVYDTMCLLRSQNMKSTRVDYAVDVFENVNPDDCHKHWYWGVANTRLRANPLRIMTSDEPGYSCYFGSKKGDKFVRVYNKAAEMKLLSEAWTRVELQTRKAVAAAFTDDLIQDGLVNAGDAAIKRFIDFPHLGWYQEAIDGNTDDWTRIPRKLENWQEWFEGQVFAAGNRRSSESGENLDWLMEWAFRFTRMLSDKKYGTSAIGTRANTGECENE